MRAAVSSTTTWERQPADAVRLVGAALVAGAAFSVSVARAGKVRTISTQIVRLLDHLPTTLTAAIVGMLQIGALLVPLVVLGFAVRRCWREFSIMVGSAALAALAASMVNGILGDSVPTVIATEAERPSWVTGAAFPSGAFVAAVGALVTVMAPSLTRPWRRVAWTGLGTVAMCRVITAVEVPINLVATMAIGVAIGSAAQVVFGAPSRRPQAEAVHEVLEAAGIHADSVSRAPDSPASRPVYIARCNGSAIAVRLLGRDERNADLLVRMVRALTTRGVEDRWPSSTRAAVEREALAHYIGRQAGAPIPAAVGVGELPWGGSFVAIEQVEGTPVAELGDDAAAGLAPAFAALGAMHRTHLAHGRPVLDEAVRDADGRVWLTNMERATPAAGQSQLATDTAQMLVSAAMVTDPQRAVAAAAAELSVEELSAALPYVQPAALSFDLARDARRDSELLPAVRAEVERVTGSEPIPMAKLQRLTVRRVLMVGATLVLANALLGLIANFADVWQAIKGMRISSIPVLAVLSLAGYPLGVLSLMGAVDVELPFGRTTQVMFAQSFLNRFTPANSGGMALRARFLQRYGVGIAAAAASIGLTSAASGVMQVLMVVLFFVWSGSDVSVGFHLPSATTVLVVIVAVLVIAGILTATTFGRRLWGKVRQTVREVLGNLAGLVRKPKKLVLLLGGSGAAKLMSIVAFAVSASAFGFSPGFGALGAMYLTATSVASASPTPGGVGAVEAALAAGLVGLGAPAATAAATVIVFRLFTYWLPILPCWLALARLKAVELA